MHLERGYRLDVVVGSCLIVEVKAVERPLPVHEAQALTYLRLTRLPAALVVNSNVASYGTGCAASANILAPGL